MRIARGQGTGDRGGQKPAAGMDAAYRIHQGLGRHSLDQVPLRPGLQRLMNVLIALVSGEHYEAGSGVLLVDGPNRLYTAHAGQAEIHRSEERRVGKEW